MSIKNITSHWINQGLYVQLMKYLKIRQIVSLLTCLLLLLAVAINKEHKVFGIPLTKKNIPVGQSDTIATLRQAADGIQILTTGQIAKDIFGYGGNIPLDIYLKEGRIIKIVVLENSETPGFLADVVDNGLLMQWDNLSPDEALEKKVDAVSGATFSSDAIILSVQRAMQYLKSVPSASGQSILPSLDFKFFCVLLVVLLGLIVPWMTKSPKIRLFQLILNVVILGFWSGSFISLPLLTNYFSNGIRIGTALIPLLLLIAAFVFPLFGKKSHYCSWLCPMGSLQELIGKAVPYKLPISAKINIYLTYFRESLWFLLLFFMWLGVGFQLMDYELFTAFLFDQAAWPIIIAACVFLLLSCVIQRPYCRFVCPTGTLLKLSQQTK